MIDWRAITAHVLASRDGYEWRKLHAWEQSAYRGSVAGVERRLDNFGRAIASAAMLATVDMRAEERVARHERTHHTARRT